MRTKKLSPALVARTEKRQEDVRKRAVEQCRRVAALLPQLENCLLKSRGFPLWLSELQDAARAIDLLAAKHVALEELKYSRE